MKKIKGFFCLLLASAFSFALFGCDSVTLTFQNGKSLYSKYTPNFIETCVYTVSKSENFLYGSYDYSAEKTDVSTGNAGTYKTVLSAERALPDGQINPIKNDAATKFYKLSTNLSIRAEYVFSDKTYVFDDSVVSESYFNDASFSLAPVYAKASYNSTSLTSDGKIFRYVYDVLTTYDSSEFHMLFTDKSESVPSPYPDDARVVTQKITDENISKNYSVRTVLDNEQLLFAVRGLDIAENFSQTISVANSTYKDAVPVAVSAKEIAYAHTVPEGFAYAVNGSDKKISDTQSVICNVVAINRSDSTFSGSPNICFYQKVTENSDTQLALLLKCVTRLPFKAGALVYTLNSAQISY